MELKTFADEDFNPTKWINKAWNNSGSQEKEIFAANTITRLQLYMKQLTNSLDETTTQIVSTVPSILQDASTLQLEGALLQQKLLNLEQKVLDVEAQTGNSIESLQRIDQLKCRLENAASALREADKWAALANSLEEMLEKGVPIKGEALSQLAAQVTAMTATLEVLSDAPDYEMKRLQLETLYNRLEAAVSSPLIEALTQMDADRTTTYVSLFNGMHRSLSLCRCWRRAAAIRLAGVWRTSNNHTLTNLTDMLTQEADRLVMWASNVLKSETPLAELMRLYTDLLLSLDPSPNKIASASLKLCPTPQEGITLLVDLKSDIDQFVKFMNNFIEAPRPNKEAIPVAAVRDLGRAAYAPLRDLLPKYTELQSQVFREYLNDPLLAQEDLIEHSRGLQTIADRVEGWLKNSLEKAKRVAGDAVYPFYVPAVENFVSAFSDHVSSQYRRVESAFLTECSSGGCVGVLSATFPAAVRLTVAVDAALQAIADRNHDYGVSDTHHPLCDLPSLLLEPEVRQRLPSLKSDPLTSVSGLRRTKDQLKSLAKSILRNPIDVQLEKIPKLTVWNNNDTLSTELPDFALSPQEYITEIGQYLMTLPQHLELHLTEKQAPLQYLSEICVHTCELYSEKILNIRNMDALGTKRCLTDIMYLSSVMEDLGSSITPALKNLEKSLRVATHSTNADQ